jgi:Uma2 family endonuclease
MTPVATPRFETLAELIDLADRLGGIPPARVLLKPTPGEATEDDLLDHIRRTDRTCELVDGTLVEKVMGMGESFLAIWMIRCLDAYVIPRDLGYFSSGDGMTRLRPGVVRAPDICFIRKRRLPNGQFEMTPIGEMIPDLTVEVISEGNTKAEIDRKIGEYFQAGVEAVWIVDPFRRVVVVHSSPESFVTLKEADTLEGSPVFPGLDLPVARIFEPVPAVKKRPRRKRGKS